MVYLLQWDTKTPDNPFTFTVQAISFMWIYKDKILYYHNYMVVHKCMGGGGGNYRNKEKDT